MACSRPHGARGSGDTGKLGLADPTRAAIEAMLEGAVAVVDAMGVTDAGFFGDIHSPRMSDAWARPAL